MIYTSYSRSALDQKAHLAESHLLPIIEAVRDHRVGLMFVTQSDAAFRLPDQGRQPAITIIGDDMHRALGPAAFHMPSLRRIIRASSSFAVISCEPLEPIYDSIAIAVSTTRRHSLIVETRPEFEAQWVDLIRKLAPSRPLCVGTVQGELA